MGISTFPATTTGVSGTPVLKLSVPSINVDYSINSTMNSYDLATPLPAGTYAITITANNPCQVVFLKNTGTLVAAGKISAVNTTTVLTVVIDIPVGETVTKIIFRKPSRKAFPTTFNVEINAITDPKSFYGHSLKQYNNAAPLPTNWTTNNINYGGPMRPGSMKVTSTSTKSYFMAFDSTFVNTPIASGTLNSNLQDGMRLYELDITTMALTQKATPQLGGTITVGAGFTFPGGSTSQNLSHFSSLVQNTFIVGTDVAYFVPGISFANYVSGGNTFYSMRAFRKMSIYQFSTNTWTDHDSYQYGIGYNVTSYVPAVCGNDFYLGPITRYLTGNWVSSNTNAWTAVSTGSYGTTIQVWHYAYNYSTSTWQAKNTTNLDGDAPNGYNPGSEVKIYSPYVKCTTNYQYSVNPTASGGSIYNPVSNTHISITRTANPSLVPDSYEVNPNNYNSSNLYLPSEHAKWAPHPTDPKLVYIAPLDSGWIYLMDTEKYGQFGVFALSTFTNGCLTRTAYPNYNNNFFVTHDGKFYNTVNSPAAGQTGSISYIAEIQPIPAALDTGY